MCKEALWKRAFQVAPSCELLGFLQWLLAHWGHISTTPDTSLRKVGKECNPNTGIAPLYEERLFHSFIVPDNVRGQNDAAQGILSYSIPTTPVNFEATCFLLKHQNSEPDSACVWMG